MRVSTFRARPLERRRDRQFAVAVALVCLYAGLLRLEAVVATHGWIGPPAWTRTVERHVVPVVQHLRPASVLWHPVENPYIGGDPVNYIKYAREMQHFYQAHVREPVFLALTRTFLWLTGGRDVAVSYASAFGSTLAVLATCLLGVMLRSRLVGVAAGLALAVEFHAIQWGADGWRDDTFMAAVTFGAAALLLLHERPSRGAGVIAGLTAAAACLTRVTAFTFVVPALAWIALFAPAGRRAEARRAAGVAAAVAAVLVAPYLINCWRVFGDPLYALNYHTRYYRSAEGQPLDESVDALEYAAAKLSARPVTTLDTAARGVTIVPFFNKWTGWRDWHPAIGPVLQWSAAAGVLLALWSPRGRLLLLILTTSLVPYALTWSVGGGGEWRFTQHAYPMYLVLAFSAITAAIQGVRTLLRHGRSAMVLTRPQLVRIALVAGALVAAWAAYVVAPVAIAREALETEGAATVTSGDRDWLFLDGDWSAPIDGGNVTVRVARSALTSVALPLEESAYRLTLRIDPPLTEDPLRQPRLSVFFNRRLLAEIDLTRDPRRMGVYRFFVPREIVTPWSRVDLLATHTVPAGEAGEPFSSLPPDAPVAFRMWYVRVERVQGSSGSDAAAARSIQPSAAGMRLPRFVSRPA